MFLTNPRPGTAWQFWLITCSWCCLVSAIHRLPVAGSTAMPRGQLNWPELGALGSALTAGGDQVAVELNFWNWWWTVSVTHRSPFGANAMPRGSWKIAFSVGAGMTAPMVRL